MKPRRSLAPAIVCLLGATSIAGAIASANAQDSQPYQASAVLPMVPEAKPGVYSERKLQGATYRLTVSGHKLTSRGAVEKYLAYRAAMLASAQKATHFTQVGAKGVTRSKSGSDSGFAFRMENWQPAWRFKLAGDTVWKTWNPASGTPFLAEKIDFAAITDFEVTADIKLHSGRMDAPPAGAFEAWAVADLLAPEVSPPA